MELAAIVRQAAERVQVSLAVRSPAGPLKPPESGARVLRFGTQIVSSPSRRPPVTVAGRG